MKKIYFILLTMAMALNFSSCDDKWEPSTPDDGEGTLSLRSLGVEVSTSETLVSRAVTDLSQYIVVITNADGKVVAEWKYAEMPEIFTLPAAENYKVTVMSHRVEKCAWDKPYYAGSKTFNIVKDEVTEPGVVVCKFANIRVTIAYTDELLAKLGDDAKVTVVANDEGRLEFTRDETRSGYFEALEGSSTLVADFTGTIEGERITLRKVYTDVAAGSHYKITFKLASGSQDIPDEEGAIDVAAGLRIDANLTVVDVDGNINIEEDLIDGGHRPGDDDEGEGGGGENPPVTEETITFSSNTLSFTEPNDPADPRLEQEAIVNIHADNGIEHLMVHIESNSADFISSAGEMVPFDFDLAYPVIDGVDWSDRLGPQGLQFPVGEAVIGQKDVVFDITNFAFLLAGFPGTHRFTITVTDGNNIQASRTLTFVAL